MAARFENVKPGDQLEQPASRMPWLRADDTRDPDRPAQVAMVTHRWYDPVERKEYVALAPIRRDGTVGDPRTKHTIRGLAQQGWRYAERDWLRYAQALEAGEVVPLRGKK